MLKTLLIKNVALISEAQIEFDEGLNVLSGETGSGKSVILECINFVLGAKADKNMIRHGEDFSFVSAEFSVFGDEYIYSLLDELCIEREDILIVSRKFTVDGKSEIKLNGRSLTLSMLRRFTDRLLDVHGQSEHFFLLKESNQLEVLDKFAGEKVKNIKKDIENEYSKLKELKDKLKEIGSSESERAMKIDLLSFQISEIETADIKEGEEDNLLEIKSKLLNQEKIILALQSASYAIEEDGGSIDALSNANRALISVSKYSSDIESVSNRLDSAICELKDIAETISSLSDMGDLGYSIEEVEDRLDIIKKIRKKYGKDLEEVNLFLQNAKNELAFLQNADEICADLTVKISKIEKKLLSLYNELSSLRKSAAKTFADNIIKELSELGMGSANFEVSFSGLDDNISFSSVSPERVEFLFSANKGEPLKPLAKIISGGEISRFMLAVKQTTSKIDDVKTFVFDEIDAGISGKIAEVVAEKFAKISKNAQILAITHLPQIAAMSDTSFLISKEEVGDKTKTFVKKLDKLGKIAEVRRLIGGEESSDAATKHAENLVKLAENYKKSI